MISNVIIRSVKIEDIDSLYNLEREYGCEVYSLDELKNQINNDLYFLLVAECEGKIIGYASITIIFEECNLLKIIVDEKYKRNKIATKLFEEIIKLCQEKNVEHIYLEVRQTNNIAISFYEKCGLKQEYVRKRYYGDADAIIYGLYLNDKKSKL